MNNKAYVIMQGCYSDKHIVKVCLDKDLAEALVEIHNKQLGINGNYYIEDYDISRTPNEEYTVLEGTIWLGDKPYREFNSYPRFLDDIVHGSYPDIRYHVTHDKIIVDRYIPIDSYDPWEEGMFAEALCNHITQSLIDALYEQLLISGKDEITIDE